MVGGKPLSRPGARQLSRDKIRTYLKFADERRFGGKNEIGFAENSRPDTITS